MEGAFLTLGLCLVTAISRVFLMKGLRNATPVAGTAFSIAVGFLFLAPFAIPRMLTAEISLLGGLVFAGIGCFAPPLVRLLTYIGVHRLGPSRADSLRSTQPFFAVALGSWIVGEQVGFRIWLAVFLTFVGVNFIARAPGRIKVHKRRSLGDLLFPVAAAALGGAATVFRKYGMTVLPDPVIGAFIAASSALVVYFGFLLVTGRQGSLKVPRESFKYFLLAGILTGVTDVLDLLALSLASVHIVAPLLSTTPLFVLLLSTIFLGKEESITWMSWAGAGFIIFSVQLIFMEAR